MQLLVLGFCPPDFELQEQLVNKSETNHIRFVEMLLRKPLDPNARSDAGMPLALHMAAHQGHFEVVKLLHEASGEVNATMERGETALHLAADSGNFEVVRFLIEAGADKDAARSDDGKTALHFAALRGHLQVVQLLVEAGAEKDAATFDGHTALHYAISSADLTCDTSPDIVQFLLEAKAANSTTGTSGERPLHTAARGGCTEIAQLLLEAGADQNSVMEDGDTALHLAAERGHSGVVRVLLEAGIHKDTCGTAEYERALQVAFEKEHWDVARLLTVAAASVS